MESLIKAGLWLYENWVLLVIALSVIVFAGKNIMDYKKLSKEKQVEIAMQIITNTISKYVADAQERWSKYESAGGIKNSQVMDIIYTKFPILATCTDQEALNKQLNELIDDALAYVRKTVDSKKQEPKVEETVKDFISVTSSDVKETEDNDEVSK